MHLLFITGHLTKQEFVAATGLNARSATLRRVSYDASYRASRGKQVYHPELFFLDPFAVLDMSSRLARPCTSLLERGEYTIAFIDNRDNASLAKMTFSQGGFAKVCFNDKYPDLLGSKWILQNISRAAFYRRPFKNDHVSKLYIEISQELYDETFDHLTQYVFYNLVDNGTDRFVTTISKGATPKVSVGERLHTLSTVANIDTNFKNEKAEHAVRLAEIYDIATAPLEDAA